MTAADAARLVQIRDRSRRLAAVALDTRPGNNCVVTDLVASADDVQWLLGQLAAANERAGTAEAIVARVTNRMQDYDRHGSGSVNVRQVLNLLSPTWPDGNYEAAPAGGDRG